MLLGRLVYNEKYVAGGNVVLQLPFDGSDTDTTTTDVSPEANVMTFAGAAEIDTAQSVAGGSSLLTTDSFTSQVTCPNNNALLFGSGSYTIEFDLRPASAANIGVVIGMYDAGQRSWSVWQQSSTIILYRSSNGVAQLTSQATITLSDNTWHHVAVCCDETTGIEIYIDGVLDTGTSNTGTLSLHDSTGKLRIGNYNADAGTQYGIQGHIDNIRVTKGAVQYTENFNPPNGTYPATAIQMDAGTGATVSQTDPASTYDTTVSIRFLSTGEVETGTSLDGAATSWTGRGTWITDTGAITGNEEVRYTGLTVTTGPGDFTTEAAIEDTWVNCSTSPVWLSNKSVGGERLFDCTFEVRDTTETGRGTGSQSYTFSIDNVV